MCQSGISLTMSNHIANLEIMKMMVQNQYAKEVKAYSICDQAKNETLNFMKLSEI